MFEQNVISVIKKEDIKFHQIIFAASLLSLIGKMCGPSFEPSSIPFIQGWFVSSFVEIEPVVLE